LKLFQEREEGALKESGDGGGEFKYDRFDAL
jgi:hypothetical protein